MGEGHRAMQSRPSPQTMQAAPSPLVATHSSSRVQPEGVPVLRAQKAALPVVTTHKQTPALSLPHGTVAWVHVSWPALQMPVSWARHL